jgi:Mn2+ and Fe2+ transporters of the NRAMP family
MVEQSKFTQIAKRFIAPFLVLGPGFLVMMADNDAGGITTYAVTGAQTKYTLVGAVVIMSLLAFVVQEMTVRLGAVTEQGHAELIYKKFGKFWGMFSLADLFISNTFTLVTEFIGIGAAVKMVFGLPYEVTIPIAVGAMILLVLSGGYMFVEKSLIAFALLQLVFIPAAIKAHPDINEVLKSFTFQGIDIFSPTFLTLFIANIGTTIAPWMLFFQQSAVVDRKMGVDDIKIGRIDTFIGSLGTAIVAASIIITTGATLYGHPPYNNIQDASEAARALVPFLGKYAGTIFAIGLFSAGGVAAVTLALSTSWAFGEVFGWEHSLNLPFQRAKWFYTIYILSVSIAGSIVLIPNAPLVLINLLVQVMNTFLLPPALLFLLLLLNDKELMGNYTNNLWSNVFVALIIVFVMVLSVVYAFQTLFQGGS